MLIVLATPRLHALREFIEALERAAGAGIVPAESGAEVLELAKAKAPALAVIDQGLPDMEPLAVVKALLQVNALINAAVLTPMLPEEFHEAAEGLGVLASLPLNPGPADAGELAVALRRITG